MCCCHSFSLSGLSLSVASFVMYVPGDKPIFYEPENHNVNLLSGPSILSLSYVCLTMKKKLHNQKLKP